MKKLAALLLAAMMLFSLVGTALAETVATQPQYKLTDVSYDGKNVTGKVVHVDGTPVAEKVNVRVTFFIFDNYYMATSQTAKEDGSFSITGIGPIEYITVLARAVVADGYQRLDAFAIDLGK